MLRHPIYLLLCVSGFSYLAWANTRGFSPFYLARTGPSSGHVTGARLMHK